MQKVLFNCSDERHVDYSASAADKYASGIFGSSELDGWTRKALYSLTVVNGTDKTGQPLYPEGV